MIKDPIVITISDEDPDPTKGAFEPEPEALNEQVVRALAELQTQWGDAEYHWVVQEVHAGITEQHNGSMAQIIDKVRDKFGVIIGVVQIRRTMDPRWDLTTRDRRGIHRSVYITALPYREPVMKPLPPKMPQEPEPLTGPEREQAVWGQLLPEVINPGMNGEYPNG